MQQQPTIPYSQQQMIDTRYVDSLQDVDEWLNVLVEVRDAQGGEPPYYLHIDHVQVLPPTGGTIRFAVLTVYHRVYLQPGL